ncbi:MAG: sulfite oxidase [Terriglobales bacterium]|jgi:DMSO/TMAO reductase YedYZ molybdopterin-dependent catalytic subunit
MTTRRDFLKHISRAVLVAGAAPFALSGPLPFQKGPPVDIAGEEGMIVRSYRFLDLETPVEYLNVWLTPVEHFFVRNHMHEPSVLDAEAWRLDINGEVDKSLTLTLHDLWKLEQHSVVNTLECPGNGRGLFRPQVPGIQWMKGAVSTARFSGPRLRDVLGRAGVKATGKHVMFSGLGEVPGEAPPFIRSIPIEKAMDSDTLIATQMNGRPLTKHHGFPARALVPGWIGAASTKWLTEITVLESESEGYFMCPAYCFPNQKVKPGDSVAPEDMHVLTALQVKSVISSPADGAVVKPGLIQISGAAWAGEADISKVEVSTDGGATWNLARLGSERARYAWRLWKHDWQARRGDYAVLARATDSRGRTQPRSPVWNPGGYFYNAPDQVKIHVS